MVGETGPDSGDSVVAFETRDHSPGDEQEQERLRKDFNNEPLCVSGDTYLRVGDFQYAVSRSLEGNYVTLNGIISDPDVTTLDLSVSLAGRRHGAVVLACDGLFEVMSNEEVGNEIIRMRKEGYVAGDIAKNLYAARH